MVKANSKSRVEERKTSANTLADTRSQRTDEGQLELLDKRFGKGQGAAKERARLIKRIGESIRIGEFAGQKKTVPEPAAPAAHEPEEIKVRPSGKPRKKAK